MRVALDEFSLKVRSMKASPPGTFFIKLFYLRLKNSRLALWLNTRQLPTSAPQLISDGLACMSYLPVGLYFIYYSSSGQALTVNFS